MRRPHRKPLRCHDRVAALDSDLLAPPFGETDDTALEDVQGWIDSEMIAR